VRRLSIVAALSLLTLGASPGGLALARTRGGVPANTAPPIVSGTDQEGSTLTESHGTWTNSPTSYSYQWQRCDSSGANCISISGASAQTYLLAGSDVGHTLRIQVWATNSRGTGGPAASQPTSPVTAASQPPPPSSAVLFGDQAVEGRSDSDPAGLAQSFQYTAAASGAISDAQVYVDGASTAANLFVGVYSNSGGNPGSLIASGTISSPKVGAWNTVPLSAGQISAGSSYWLAFLSTSGTLAWREHGSGGQTSYVSQGRSLSSLPSTWTSGNGYPVGPASAYVEASGTSASPPTPPAPPSNAA
jgi:hypothetical protein